MKGWAIFIRPLTRTKPSLTVVLLPRSRCALNADRMSALPAGCPRSPSGCRSSRRQPPATAMVLTFSLTVELGKLWVFSSPLVSIRSIIRRESIASRRLRQGRLMKRRPRLFFLDCRRRPLNECEVLTELHRSICYRLRVAQRERDAVVECSRARQAWRRQQRLE